MSDLCLTPIRRQGSIFFGFGDAPLLDNAVGQISDVPDFICNCIPEPASMLLIGLAGLFLRRR